MTLHVKDSKGNYAMAHKLLVYAYNLSFAGNQSNYAAALAITMAVITIHLW